jgi:hypothetical protein
MHFRKAVADEGSSDRDSFRFAQDKPACTLRYFRAGLSPGFLTKKPCDYSQGLSSLHSSDWARTSEIGIR